MNIPDTVTSIGEDVFGYGCFALKSIIIPKNVTYIGKGAFGSYMQEITIENPDCVIYDWNETLRVSLIHGYEGSTAQEYANKYSIPFVVLDGKQDTPTTTTTTEPATTATTTTATTTTSTTEIITTTTKIDTTIAGITTTENTTTTVGIPIESTTTGTPGNTTETSAIGDMNGDNIVDSLDASEVLAVYALSASGSADEITENQMKIGDIDKNGIVDSADASLILEYYAYISSDGNLSFEDYLNEKSS